MEEEEASSVEAAVVAEVVEMGGVAGVGVGVGAWAGSAALTPWIRARREEEERSATSYVFDGEECGRRVERTGDRQAGQAFLPT